MYLETDAKYPAVFKEFNQHAEGGSPSIFSGREENSFLVSFTESAALLRAIRGSKDSLKLINVRIVSN